MFGKFLSRGDHHRVGYALSWGARGDHGETNGRKNVDIVALRNGNAAAFEPNRRERRARGYESAAIGPPKQIRGIGFGVLRGIRQWKNNGPLELAGHFSDDGLGECRTYRREANENRCANVVD